ncbi:hypothetical protein Avbf_14819 [Armadillidium vulgare]|nr:hypothetical protein Avbf_14819 [Armadillidium vulgare]
MIQENWDIFHGRIILTDSKIEIFRYFGCSSKNLNLLHKLVQAEMNLVYLVIGFININIDFRKVSVTSKSFTFYSLDKNLYFKNIIQFVKFKDKNDSMVHKKIVNDGDDFLWDMQFEGYPRNLIYTFYNPYGELFLHKDKRANASYVYEEGKLSLSIKRVTVEDFGNYSVRLEAPNGSYDENYVMLVVNGTPKAQFSEIPSVLPPDKYFTINLFILAFNLNKSEPDVFCYFEPYCPIGLSFCNINKTYSVNQRMIIAGYIKLRCGAHHAPHRTSPGC